MNVYFLIVEICRLLSHRFLFIVSIWYAVYNYI